APPMGGDPMAGGMGGAPPMGGDPMGGGMPMPPGGIQMPENKPPVIPKYADVWDVLDHILNQKPLEHDADVQRQQANDANQSADQGLPPPPGGDLSSLMS